MFVKLFMPLESLSYLKPRDTAWLNIMTWSWELPSEIKLDSLQKIFLEWAGIDLGFPRMLARRSTTELSKLDTLKRNFSSNKLLSQLRGERGDDLLLQNFFEPVPCDKGGKLTESREWFRSLNHNYQVWKIGPFWCKYTTLIQNHWTSSNIQVRSN